MLKGAEMVINRFNKVLCLSIFVTCFCLSPVCAYTVMWDVSHGAYTTMYIPTVAGSYYQSLSQELQNNGFNIQITPSKFDTADMSNVDVAVINDWTSVYGAYGQTEINALQNFVSNGGGLLVMADSEKYTNYSALVESFGISFTSRISDPVTADILGSHPVSEGITNIYIKDAIGLDVSASDQVAGTYTDAASEFVVTASAEYGLGRVFVVGDATLWTASSSTDYFNMADNAEFAVNVFEYLATEPVPEPATLLLMAAGSWMLSRKRKR